MKSCTGMVWPCLRPGTSVVTCHPGFCEFTFTGFTKPKWLQPACPPTGLCSALSPNMLQKDSIAFGPGLNSIIHLRLSVRALYNELRTGQWALNHHPYRIVNKFAAMLYCEYHLSLFIILLCWRSRYFMERTKISLADFDFLAFIFATFNYYEIMHLKIYLYKCGMYAKETKK